MTNMDQRIEQRMTEMPQIGIVRRREVWAEYNSRWRGKLNSWEMFNLTTVTLLEEQRRLLATEGWMKLRTEEEFRNKFADIMEKRPLLLKHFAGAQFPTAQKLPLINIGEQVREVLVELYHWLATGEGE